MTYKYFTANELKCHCGKCDSIGEEMDRQFMQQMEMLRSACGFPFIVDSAYRCPEHNSSVSSTGHNGPHTTGMAMDIKVDREQAYTLLKEAFKFNFGGFGIDQKGDGRFIHIDACRSADGYPRPNIWSY